MVNQKVCKKKYLSWVYGVGRKICHSGSLFGITRQASWCRSVTLVTDFSIHTIYPWKILIILTLGQQYQTEPDTPYGIETRSEWRSSGSKEQIKETKIAESTLLFICSNVTVQHCPRPLAPASAKLCLQTDSKWTQWSQRTRKYTLHYDDVRGYSLRLSQWSTTAAVKIK